MKRCYSTLKMPLYSYFRLLSFVDSCQTMNQIRQTHAQLITLGLIIHPIHATKLIKRLSFLKISSVSYAHHLFDQIPMPDVFLYNTMIQVHELASVSSFESFLIFRSVVRDSCISPNHFTFIFALKACGSKLGVSGGEQIRVQAIKFGLESNLYVSNTLIRMYVIWGLVDHAKKVFDFSIHRDLYSWNILIGGYVASGRIEQAKTLFDGMPERNVVSWSTIITAYTQAGSYKEALDIFHKMLNTGPIPNEFTLVSALVACANLVSLDQGRWIHHYIYKNKIRVNDWLLASLIHMYSKCGKIDLASKVFYSNPKQTVWPWNAMIGGFALHGKPSEAINLFEKMNTEMIRPNKVTFIALLNACSHGNMVEMGRSYFESMSSVFGVEPELVHYGCLVDLLGRAGLLNEAEEVIVKMPMTPGASIWGALLGACKIHKDCVRAERVAEIMKGLDSENVGCDVLYANLLSVSGRWGEARGLREKMEVKGRKKIHGLSSIVL